MAMTQEEFRVRITGKDDSGQAFDSLRRRTTEIGGAIGALTSRLGALGVGLSAAGIVSFARDAVKSLGDIADEADRVGVSTDLLQALRYQVKLTGADAGDAVTALQKFGVQLGDAGAEGNYLRKVLDANNVALKDGSGTWRSAGALLEDYARLVANASSQQEKLMLTQEAFGRSGTKLVGLLDRIAQEGLAGVIDQSRIAGQVIDKELIKIADEFDDAWRTSTDAVTNYFKALVVEAIRTGKSLSESLRLDFVPQGRTLADVGIGTGASREQLQRGDIAALLRQGIAMGGAKPLGGAVDIYNALKFPGGATTVIPTKKPESEKNRTAEIIELLRLEGEQLTLNNEARRDAERLEMQINMIRRAGVSASEADKDAIRGAVDALYAKKAAFEATKDAAELLSDALKGIKNDLMAGKTVAEALGNALERVASKLADKAIDNFINMALSGATGSPGSLVGGIGKLFGFAHGGAFTVGGSGGADSQLVAFRATPGEQVTVRPRSETAGNPFTLVYSPSISTGMTPTDRAWLQTQLERSKQEAVALMERRLSGRLRARSDALWQQ